MQRPGVELASSRSQVRPPNHYTQLPKIIQTLHELYLRHLSKLPSYTRHCLPDIEKFNQSWIVRIDVSEPMRQSRDGFGVVLDERSGSQLTKLSRA